MTKFPKIKAWTEWQVAAKGGNPQDQDDKCDAIRAVQASVAGSNENEWLNNTKSVFECYKSLTKQDVTDVATWIKGVMQAKDWSIQVACLALQAAHQEVEGADGATERQRVETFLADLEAAGVAKKHIPNFLVKLKEKNVLKVQMARMFTPDFIGAHKTVITALCGAQGATVPDWLPKALLHVTKVPAKTFWLVQTKDKAVIDRASASVYADDWWKDNKYANAVIANDFAKIVVADASKHFHQMFDGAQWKEMSATAKAEHVDDPVSKLIAIGAARGGDDKVQGHLGDWIVEHREVVLRLIKHGYSAAVIAEMETQKLGHREMIALTWMHGAEADDDAKLIVVFKEKDQKGDPVHGFWTAPTKHLAERHLYSHFQFDAKANWPGDEAIKALNSFHPHGTTQQNLADLRKDIALPHLADGEQTIANYKLVANRDSKRLQTLYPVLANNHSDHYVKVILEKMKKVATKLKTPYKHDLPEIAWFPAPR